MERSAENGNFEMCKGSIIKSHKKYMVDTMIVYELALGLFALQFQDLFVAQN